MASEGVEFRGFVGRTARRVTTADGVITAAAGGGKVEQVRPESGAWGRFWGIAEELDVWRWEAAYGRMLSDGRPWSLTLRRGDRELRTAGNDFEEYAPPGIRRLMLALDELLAGRLLAVEDARALANGYRLTVTVTRESRPPISETVLLRRLFEEALRVVAEVGAAWQVRAYTLGGERSGGSFLLAAPPGAEVLAALRRSLAGRMPVVTLRDLGTGVETVL